jgi:hypothetical protein
MSLFHLFMLQITAHNIKEILEFKYNVFLLTSSKILYSTVSLYKIFTVTSYK